MNSNTNPAQENIFLDEEDDEDKSLMTIDFKIGFDGNDDNEDYLDILENIFLKENKEDNLIVTRSGYYSYFVLSHNSFIKDKGDDYPNKINKLERSSSNEMPKR